MVDKDDAVDEGDEVDEDDEGVAIDAPSKPIKNMPIWLDKLEDQGVTVGSALLYRIGLPLDRFGQRMIVFADLGEAAAFADYDSQTGFLKVHSTELSAEHVGIYEVTFLATSLNTNSTETFF